MLGISAVFQSAPAISSSIIQTPVKDKNHFQSVDNGNRTAVKISIMPSSPTAIVPPKLLPPLLLPAMCYLLKIITSTPKRPLPHAYRVKETMSAMTTLEATNKVIPFLSMKLRMSALWASKLSRSIQPWHLPPPIETIVPPYLNVSIPI